MEVALDIKIEKMRIQQRNYSLSADLEIKGGTTAIIGPSGGGKSTLLLAIAGFVELATGDISVGPRLITHTEPAKRPVTLLFQENNLFPHMTVFQNTGLGVRPDLKLSKPQIEQVEDALEKVGLAGMGTRRPSELSGGQRQRVALARALLRDRPVLMLDEPFAALGPALRHGGSARWHLPGRHEDSFGLVPWRARCGARVAGWRPGLGNGLAARGARTGGRFAMAGRARNSFCGRRRRGLHPV